MEKLRERWSEFTRRVGDRAKIESRLSGSRSQLLASICKTYSLFSNRVCVCVCVCVCVESPSCVQLFATSWTVAWQAPLSMGFSRQKDWSGLPFPSPEALPDPGVVRSPALQADSAPSEPPGEPCLDIFPVIWEVEMGAFIPALVPAFNLDGHFAGFPF